ncbi:MAG: hypothetical protein M3020_05340 [Myxococcota bacterium]|nr:hypothetical protein [Myxococcota bacterium]
MSAAAAAFGCSSDTNEPAAATGGETSVPTTGGSGTGGSPGSNGGTPGSTGGSPSSTGGDSSTGGSASDPDAIVGTFTVTLNPAAELMDAYTSVIGKVYSGAYPTDVIETPLASGNGCTTFKFSRQSCIDVTCTGSQVCAAPDVCRDVPKLVSVGKVSIAGIDPGSLMLSGVNNNYQYPADITYPGFAEGAAITLSASGDFYPAFEVSTTGVAPAVMKADSYLLAPGQPLALEWEPGGNADADVSIVLNISKHGGSAGYLRCDTTDTGSLTIPADVLRELIDLGVAGFPSLTLTRRTRGVTPVTGGKVALDVAAEAHPPLDVEGYCSCFNSSDCGSCSDATKTVCDSVRKLCNAP